MTLTPDGQPGNDPTPPPHQAPDAPPPGDGTPPKRGVSKKAVAFGAAGVVALGLVAGGAYAVLGGGGPQPEDVLPGNAIAFTKLDLDPGAGQKLALYQLSKKFPAVAGKVKSEDSSIEDAALGSMLDDEAFGLTYDKVKPWLGKRAAVGVFPASSTDTPVDVGVVLAVTDREKAEAALKSAGGDIGHSFADDDFVVISEDAATAKRIVEQGKKAPLADAKDFSNDMAALGGDQFALAWVDLGKVWDIAEKEASAADVEEFRGLVGQDLKGRVVLGLHAGSDYVELQGKGFGTDSPGAKLGTENVGALLSRLPSDAVGALAVSGLGDVLTKAQAEMSKNGGANTFEEMTGLGELGIGLPDVATVLGSLTAVAVTDPQDPKVGVVTRNDDPQKALDILSPLAEAMGPEVFRAERTDNGLVAGTSAGLLTQLKAGKGGLTGTEKFKRVVADPNGGLVAYVDIAQLVDANLREEPGYADAKPFEAAGLVAKGGDDASFRLRVSFR